MTGESERPRAVAPAGLTRPLQPRQLWTDAAIAAGFFLVFGMIPLGFPVVPALTPVIGLVMAGALAIRRLSPALALAVAWAGAILQMAAGFDVLPSNLAIFGVLYVTAAYGTRTVLWLGFASALAGSLVAAIYLTVYNQRWFWVTGIDLVDALAMGGAWFLATLFALLLSWTTGALRRSSLAARATRLAQARAEAETAAEAERGRIARDMHDVVAHSLAVVVAQADGARYAAQTDPQAAQDALGTISQTARAALADVRLLLAQLRHREADGPQPTLADLETLFAQVRGAGVELSVDIDPLPPGEAPAAVQLAVYRILQEALTNALRHGDGGAVDIRMSWAPDQVRLAVSNPVAADSAPPGEAVVPPGGHGLIGMRERAQLVGGRFETRRDGRIFVVHADLPVSGYGATT